MCPRPSPSCRAETWLLHPPVHCKLTQRRAAVGGLQTRMDEHRGVSEQACPLSTDCTPSTVLHLTLLPSPCSGMGRGQR